MHSNRFRISIPKPIMETDQCNSILVQEEKTLSVEMTVNGIPYVSCGTVSKIFSCDCLCPNCDLLCFDSRPYEEYKAFHLPGARHFETLDELTRYFDASYTKSHSILFIDSKGCENSRSPYWYQMFRNYDRQVSKENGATHPLRYSDMYVLSGGMEKMERDFPNILCRQNGLENGSKVTRIQTMGSLKSFRRQMGSYYCVPLTPPSPSSNQSPFSLFDGPAKSHSQPIH